MAALTTGAAAATVLLVAAAAAIGWWSTTARPGAVAAGARRVVTVIAVGPAWRRSCPVSAAVLRLRVAATAAVWGCPVLWLVIGAGRCAVFGLLVPHRSRARHVWPATAAAAAAVARGVASAPLLVARRSRWGIVATGRRAPVLGGVVHRPVILPVWRSTTSSCVAPAPRRRWRMLLVARWRTLFVVAAPRRRGRRHEAWIVPVPVPRTAATDPAAEAVLVRRALVVACRGRRSTGCVSVGRWWAPRIDGATVVIGPGRRRPGSVAPAAATAVIVVALLHWRTATAVRRSVAAPTVSRRHRTPTAAVRVTRAAVARLVARWLPVIAPVIAAAVVAVTLAAVTTTLAAVAAFPAAAARSVVPLARVEVHAQLAAVQLLSVERFVGRLRELGRGHGHEPKAARLGGVFLVANHARFGDFPNRVFERFPQAYGSSGPRQATDEQLAGVAAYRGRRTLLCAV